MDLVFLRLGRICLLENLSARESLWMLAGSSQVGLETCEGLEEIAQTTARFRKGRFETCILFFDAWLGVMFSTANHVHKIMTQILRGNALALSTLLDVGSVMPRSIYPPANFSSNREIASHVQGSFGNVTSAWLFLYGRGLHALSVRLLLTGTVGVTQVDFVESCKTYELVTLYKPGEHDWPGCETEKTSKSRGNI